MKRKMMVELRPGISGSPLKVAWIALREGSTLVRLLTTSTEEG